MKCIQCAAPRTAWAKACRYCGLVFDSYRESTDPVDPEPAPAQGSAKAVDGGAARMSGGATAAKLAHLGERADVKALLAERDGLPSPPRQGGIANLFPLALTAVFAAIVLHQTRLEDGSFPQGSLAIAGGFVAIGLFAVFRGAQRARHLASVPVVAELAEVRVRNTARDEQNVGEAPGGRRRDARTRWLLALSEGRERHVWMLDDTAGKEQLQHGATGVAWTQGPHLLRFERVNA